jgi:hypothetical protein
LSIYFRYVLRFLFVNHHITYWIFEHGITSICNIKEKDMLLYCHYC